MQNIKKKKNVIETISTSSRIGWVFKYGQPKMERSEFLLMSFSQWNSATTFQTFWLERWDMSRKPINFTTLFTSLLDLLLPVLHCDVFDRLRVHWKREDCVCLSWGLGQYQLLVSFSPFKLEISCDGEEIVTLNPENKLYFETLQDPTRCEEQYMRTVVLYSHKKLFGNN